MTCGIYMIKNKQTGQIYIGKSVNIERRWKEHCYGHDKKNSYIDNAIQKYGQDNFIFLILHNSENDSTLLNELEKYYIWKYNSFYDKKHYNLTKGGEYSPSTNLYTAAKISKALIGRKSPMKNKKHSVEVRKKISKKVSCNKKNKSGFFRVSKNKQSQCKQGFVWRYQYVDDNGKRHSITSVDIKKLEQKVKKQGLEWYKII